MNFDKLKKIIENSGWQVNIDETIGNESELEIRQYTPAGEDWGIVVFFDGTVEDAINEIVGYAENYDYNDEQGELIAMRGQSGIPDDIETLVEDGKWKQEVLLDLAEKLKNINLDENKKITEADDENDIELNDNESDEDVKVNEILSELKDISPLYERVISEIEEDSEDYNGDTKTERVLARLSDISHGLSSGIVSSLVYYVDTSKFFDEYYDDIYDMLDEWEENGFQFLDTLKNNHSETEIIMNTDSVKNDVVWAVYEYIASNLDDEILQI